ncbi:MAG TPA: hypothetical protein VJ576_01285 [Rhodocyclaceae bacterium]|nr:hypothetical protein [Rhodocyclaceae bacterium]
MNNGSAEDKGAGQNSATWWDWIVRHDVSGLFVSKNDQELFKELVWQPDNPDRQAAWKLYTELRTRITTQPLRYGTGDEATALRSVYELFGLSRSLIQSHYGCTHFASIATRVLNYWVRPFTAKWHRVSVEGRLASTDVRFSFRIELDELRSHLLQFSRLLGILAEDPEAELADVGETETDQCHVSDKLWESVKFGLSAAPGTGDNATPAINAAEKSDIRARRLHYGCANAESDVDAVGLAISGGGIRSAIFALGVVQTLARRGILRDVDYLSTVSGGGYLGAFITSILGSSGANVGLEAGQQPFGAMGERENIGVRHLRNHSKYLSEGGARTLMTVVALGVYGLIITLMLAAPFLLLGALLIVSTLSDGSLATLPSPTFSQATVYMAMVLAIAVACLPAFQTFASRQIGCRWEQFCIWLAVAFSILLLWEAMPSLIKFIRPNSVSVVIGSLAVAIGSAIVGLWQGPESRGGRFALGLAAMMAPILLFVALLTMCVLIADALEGRWCFGLIALGLLVYTGVFVNINFASPHRYYRNRLARTYLTILSENKLLPVDPQLLSLVNPLAKAPYHIINAALNIPASDNPDLRGRNTDFFSFSKHFCGSPLVGYFPTRDWEAVDSHLDLGTAIAISGAAAAPHMGTLNSARYRLWLAMLNVRLGYWLCHATKPRWWRKLPPPGWLYFVRELTGRMDEKTRYLNLSDGGHIENLGIYELLRRKCKFIIAIDGEADPKRVFGGFLTLTQLAYIDLGVKIEPDLSDLRTEPDGHERAHFGLSQIDYPDGDKGLLFYIKSSMTGNEPEFIRKYRDDYPDFPHQSTLQQLFSETQFEAYRALGEHIANDLFRKDLVGGDWNNDHRTRTWFERLAKQLLP